MKQYTYTLPKEVTSTARVVVHDESGEAAFFVARRYRNGLQKLLDAYFDYRYFLTYETTTVDGEPTYQIQKKIRRGKLWFDVVDKRTNDKYIVSYENWRIGLPELTIRSDKWQINIDKQMEGWSIYYVEQQEIARWQAVYQEELDKFLVVLQIEETSPVQQADFFVAISQATLFIGS